MAASSAPNKSDTETHRTANEAELSEELQVTKKESVSVSDASNTAAAAEVGKFLQSYALNLPLSYAQAHTVFTLLGGSDAERRFPAQHQGA